MIQYQKNQLVVFESALYRTTSTVFYNEDLVLIVDPTWLPAEVARIKKYVASIQNDQQLFLLFTHSDYDHILAAGAFPEARTIASAVFVQNPNKEKIIEEIKVFDDTYYIKRNYPIRYPEIDWVVQESGQQLSVKDTTFYFYLAPGHNADGIITYIAPYGIWIMGDYLSNIEFPYLYHSGFDYLSTLQSFESYLVNYPFDLLIPGHGDVAVTMEEVNLRIKESKKYIEDLSTCVKTNTDFDITALWRRYDFSRGMLNFHEANLQLLKKEIEREV